MSGYYGSQGVAWLDEALPAARFPAGPWDTATPHQASLLVPGQALTTAWNQEQEHVHAHTRYTLLPGDLPDTVTGLAWTTRDPGGDDGARLHLLDTLNRFAACADGASAVIWGVAVGYEVEYFPQVITYTPGTGFTDESLPEQGTYAFFHPAQCRTAVFTAPTPGNEPAAEERRRVPADHFTAVLTGLGYPTAASRVRLVTENAACPDCLQPALFPADGNLGSSDEIRASVCACQRCDGTGFLPLPG
ncbi:hypothetical protein ABTY61_22790 [Kitasatospora sp. NPDC096128]|uniref:hypothetical protein n=1 Tax=Kitasatospora sp. NPDC096128 TaxID=3155547 RepID=UPI00332F2E21